MDKEQLFKDAVKVIKRSLKKSQWWGLVQEGFKIKLELILDNLDTLGMPFKSAYIAAFKYHHICRLLSGKSFKATMPGVLFGAELTEETYQCAIEPTKSLLVMDDWTLPTEADVQACIFICNHLERLEKQFRRIEQDNSSVFNSLMGPLPGSIEDN